MTASAKRPDIPRDEGSAGVVSALGERDSVRGVLR
jgi:hypothetical protein